MKTLKILSMAAGLLLVQAAAAQSPAISTRYTNEKIAQLVKAHKASHPRDVAPPENLRQKLHADFPSASDVEWEASDSLYEVEFDVRFSDWKAYYDAEGNLLMTVEELFRYELPAVVKNAAKAKYPKYRIEDIRKIRCGTALFYKVEMELRDAEVELLLQPNGETLSEKIDY